MLRRIVINIESDKITKVTVDDAEQILTPSMDRALNIANIPATTDLLLGHGETGDASFDGILYMMGLRNSILTASEITGLETNVFPTMDCLILNTKVGYDISGNANHGIATNITKTEQDEFNPYPYGAEKYIKCNDGTKTLYYAVDNGLAWSARIYDSSAGTWSDVSGTTTDNLLFLNAGNENWGDAPDTWGGGDDIWGGAPDIPLATNDLVKNILVGDKYISTDPDKWYGDTASFEEWTIPALSTGKDALDTTQDASFVTNADRLANLDMALKFGTIAKINNLTGDFNGLLAYLVVPTSSEYAWWLKDLNPKTLMAYMLPSLFKEWFVGMSEDDRPTSYHNIVLYNDQLNDSQFNQAIKYLDKKA